MLAGCKVEIAKLGLHDWTTRRVMEVEQLRKVSSHLRLHLSCDHRLGGISECYQQVDAVPMDSCWDRSFRQKVPHVGWLPRTVSSDRARQMTQVEEILLQCAPLLRMTLETFDAYWRQMTERGDWE